MCDRHGEMWRGADRRACLSSFALIMNVYLKEITDMKMYSVKELTGLVTTALANVPFDRKPAGL